MYSSALGSAVGLNALATLFSSQVLVKPWSNNRILRTMHLLLVAIADTVMLVKYTMSGTSSIYDKSESRYEFKSSILLAKHRVLSIAIALPLP